MRIRALIFVKSKDVIPASHSCYGDLTMSPMRLPQSNFPDEVWSRLKAWAAAQTRADVIPSIEDCAAYVRFAAEEITGRPDSLPPQVVNFYAAEAALMIDRMRRDAGFNT